MTRGAQDPPKNNDIICEQPLIGLLSNYALHDGTNRQADTQTDIANNRRNWPRGWLSDNITKFC